MSQDRQELVFAAVGLLELLVQPLALSDVSGDLGRPNDPLALIFDRGNAQGHIDSPPIFAHPNRLKMLDALPTPETLQERRQLIGMIGRNEKREGLADNLL